MCSPGSILLSPSMSQPPSPDLAQHYPPSPLLGTQDFLGTSEEGENSKSLEKKLGWKVIECGNLCSTKQVPLNIKDVEKRNRIEAIEYRVVPEKEKVEASLESALKEAEEQQQEAERNVGGKFKRFGDFLLDKERTLIPKYQLSEGRKRKRASSTTGSWTEDNPMAKRSITFSEKKGTRGSKKVMEDISTFVLFEAEMGGVKRVLNFSAVFDGHGGNECALFASETLEHNLQERIKEFCFLETDLVGPFNALKLALVDVGLSYCQARGEGIPYRERVGSTANVALISQEHLWLANLGDSGAVLVGTDGSAKQLCPIASPKDLKYRKGVEKRGGRIVETSFNGKIESRVNGSLAVAAALGDAYLEGVLKKRPRITQVPLPSEGNYLVQFSDGLSDVAAPSQIGQLIHMYLKKGYSLEEVAEGLTEAARSAGSTDDISVIISRFS